MLELLNILLLAAHLLAMNIASGGPLLCIWLRGRHEPQNEDTAGSPDSLGRQMAYWSILGLIAGMALGGAQLWLTRSDGLLEAINRLPRRALWFAGLELLFSVACLSGYLASWNKLRHRRKLHASIALLSSSNLLYHFPPLMSVLGKVAADPAWAKAEVLDRPALLTLMRRPEIVALTTHFALASIAVAAIAILYFMSGSGATEKARRQMSLARGAAWIALIVSALQLPVGVWLVASLPKSGLGALMGENLTASAAFATALLLTLMLLQKLLTIAIGEVTASELRHPSWLLMIIVLLMTVSLIGTRQRATELTAAQTELSDTSLNNSLPPKKPQSNCCSAALDSLSRRADSRTRLSPCVQIL
ncbi:MAG: hypothetical protein AAGD11_17855 [Planctomycetota bacterium]